MEPWKRTLWILWVGAFFSGASYTMSIPFISLYLLELGVQDASVNLWVGFIQFSSYLVGALMGPVWGSLSDRYGRKRTLVCTGFGIAFAYALLGLVRTPEQLLAARVFQGFVVGFIPGANAIVASAVPEKELSKSMGIMQSAAISGSIFGPLFGGTLSALLGMRMSFFAAAGFMTLAVLPIVFWVRGVGKPSPQAEKSNVIKDFKWVWDHKTMVFLLFLLLLFQIANNMMVTLMPLHIAGMYQDPQNAAWMSGIVLGLAGIAGMIAAPLWGRAGQQRGVANILFICLCFAGVAIGMQFFVPYLGLFAMIQFLYGLFMSGIAPSINTLVVQIAGPSFRGRAFGFTQLANQSGLMMGPLLGGTLGFYLSTNWIFPASGLILLAAGTFAFIRLVKKPADAVESDVR